MGREAMGTIRTAAGKGRAKVLLETDELIFRGEVRARVPFAGLSVVEPGSDGLKLVWPDGEATVELSEKDSARWADRIANPPTLLDKLGVETGTTVVVLEPDYGGFADGTFAAGLADRRGGNGGGGPPPGGGLGPGEGARPPPPPGPVGRGRPARGPLARWG